MSLLGKNSLTAPSWPGTLGDDQKLFFYTGRRCC